MHSPEIIKAAAKMIRAGVRDKEVASALGISSRTVTSWRAQMGLTREFPGPKVVAKDLETMSPKEVAFKHKLCLDTVYNAWRKVHKETWREKRRRERV